jgi:hypothetical protein
MESKTMETKEELITNIKEWLKMDNEIAKLQGEIKTRKTKKKALSVSLVDVMKKNAIDCFDIAGGSLMYKKNKIKKPINGKSLMMALQTYYKDTPQLADDISKHIMASREEQVKETISRKMKKCDPV